MAIGAQLPNLIPANISGYMVINNRYKISDMRKNKSIIINRRVHEDGCNNL